MKYDNLIMNSNQSQKSMEQNSQYIFETEETWTSKVLQVGSGAMME